MKKKKVTKKVEPKKITDSKQYTIEELVELGKKHNYISLAPPLFNELKCKSKK
jgi:hypothetical protein